jgi:hypothetical protein
MATLMLDPDEGDPRDLLALPEGTYKLHVEAYWNVTRADGKFMGGITEFNIELERS